MIFRYFLLFYFGWGFFNILKNDVILYVFICINLFNKFLIINDYNIFMKLDNERRE